LRLAKGFGIGIILLQLAGLILSGLSFHTLFSVTSAALTSDAFRYASSDDDSTGEMTVKVEGELRNYAFLAADIYLEAEILNVEEEYVASNSTSVHLGAGKRQPLTLTIRIPEEEAERWRAGEDKGSLEFTFGIRTLENLVGFSSTSIIPMGGGE